MLVPEVEARRALRDYRIRLRVLAPFGAWTGCGVLRVLRCKIDSAEPFDSAQDDKGSVELVAGYESYRP